MPTQYSKTSAKYIKLNVTWFSRTNDTNSTASQRFYMYILIPLQKVYVSSWKFLTNASGPMLDRTVTVIDIWANAIWAKTQELVDTTCYEWRSFHQLSWPINVLFSTRVDDIKFEGNKHFKPKKFDVEASSWCYMSTQSTMSSLPCSWWRFVPWISSSRADDVTYNLHVHAYNVVLRIIL